MMIKYVFVFSYEDIFKKNSKLFDLIDDNFKNLKRKIALSVNIER